MVVNSCYISRGVRVRKVSIGKCHLQGHWRALAWCHSIGHIRFSISLPLQLSLSCTVIDILSFISENLKRSRDSEHIAFGGNISRMWYIMHVLVLLCINQHTKFEVPSFTNSKDMTGAFKKRVTWPWQHPLGIVCHPKVSTWYILLAYKIWRLSLQPFRRYDCGHRNWKWVVWPWPRLFKGGLSSWARTSYSLPVCKIWRL